MDGPDDRSVAVSTLAREAASGGTHGASDRLREILERQRADAEHRRAGASVSRFHTTPIRLAAGTGELYLRTDPRDATSGIRVEIGKPVDKDAEQKRLAEASHAVNPEAPPEANRNLHPIDNLQAVLDSRRPGCITIKQDDRGMLVMRLDAELVKMLTQEELMIFHSYSQRISPQAMERLAVNRGENLNLATLDMARMMIPPCFCWCPPLVLLLSGPDLAPPLEEGQEPRLTNTVTRAAFAQMPYLMRYLMRVSTEISALTTAECQKITDPVRRSKCEDMLEATRAQFDALDRDREVNFNKMRMWALAMFFGAEAKSVPKPHPPTFEQLWGDISDPERVESRRTALPGSVQRGEELEALKKRHALLMMRASLEALGGMIIELAGQKSSMLCSLVCQLLNLNANDFLFWGQASLPVPQTPSERSTVWPKGGFAPDFGYLSLVANLKNTHLPEGYDADAMLSQLERDKDLIMGTRKDSPMELKRSGGSLSLAWVYYAFVMSAIFVDVPVVESK